MLENTIDKILKMRSVLGRIYYLCSAFIFVTINIFISLILLIAADNLAKNLPPEIFVLCYVAAFASLGGFLSLALKLEKLDVDPDSPWHFYLLSGISRIAISVVAGVFVYMLIRADLLVGFVMDLDSKSGILVFAFLAGFSETLVPDILRKIESKTVDTEGPGSTPTSEPSSR